MAKNKHNRLGEYHRVLLKISGEALMGQSGFGIDAAALQKVAEEVKSAYDNKYQICLVVGGGNIFRGMSAMAEGIDRATADYMGMLATVMNAVALQRKMEDIGMPTRVMSALAVDAICEPYIRRRAVRHMEKGRIVIFAAGTGNPFFTTDTAAALRAREMDCQVILKGTKVDGVYDDDPTTNPNAKRFDHLTYTDVLTRNLRVMDATAVSLCREHGIPIIVFSLFDKGALSDVLKNERTCTVVSANA